MKTLCKYKDVSEGVFQIDWFPIAYLFGIYADSIVSSKNFPPSADDEKIEYVRYNST